MSGISVNAYICVDSSCVAGTANGVTTTCCQTNNCNSSSTIKSSIASILILVLMHYTL